MSLVTNSTLLIHVESEEYPISLAQLRRRHPNISLPLNPTEEQVAALGYAVVQNVERPSGDVVTEGVPVVIEGVYTQQWEVRPFNQEELANQLEIRKQGLRERINQLREENFDHGFRYVFPDGEEQGFQLRTEDRVNLVGPHMEAKAYIDAGIPEATFDFRTYENKTKELTAPQVIEFTEAAMQYVKNVYAASWSLKDLIDAAQSVEELPVIPDKLA